MGTLLEIYLLDKEIKGKIVEYLLPNFPGMALNVYDGSKDGNNITFYMYNKTDQIRFSLTEYPGNCGIIISHDMLITQNLRGKGIAQGLQKFKEDIAKLYGYSFMRCTTVENNAVENHILKKYGWMPIRKFLNNRTGNWCIEWEKKL